MFSSYVPYVIHLAFSNFDDFGSQKFCAAISQHGASKPSKADTVQFNLRLKESKKRDEMDGKNEKFLNANGRCC